MTGLDDAPRIVREQPRYQREPGTDIDVWHLDGIRWRDAPQPRFFLHRHIAQTVGWVSYLDLVFRCPCGAMQINNGGWGQPTKI